MTTYNYQPLDGYRFICHVFTVIVRDREMKAVFNENLKDIQNTVNDRAVMDLLSEQWTRFSSVTLINGTEIREALLNHYQAFHARKNEDGRFILDSYDKDWLRTVRDIVANRKETRDPKVALGLATIISTAMLNHADRCFYIGVDEAKKILFLCLSYFGFQEVEFIPEECFDETENLRKLLFSALYSTLLFLYPAKGGQTRDNNYTSGARNILLVIESDPKSKLFTAFQHAAEAREVAEQLWVREKSDEQYLDVDCPAKLLVSDYYIVPRIETKTNMGVLSCEKGLIIRSLVEGKSGSGKTTLARMISFICQTEGGSCGSAKFDELAACLDYRRRMWPLSIDCRNLESETLERGIISCSLDQMRMSDSSLRTISPNHFKECKEYLLAFCNHKILQEELLLIIDDYSKLPSECADLFNENLKYLCRETTLHIIVITDKLKPSAVLKLGGSFNKFTIDNIYVDSKYVAAVVSESTGKESGDIRPDLIVQNYVNTPRRLLRYIESQINRESILDVIDSCIGEELDVRKHYFEQREEYPRFFRSLALHALRERESRDRRNSRLVISDKQVKAVLKDNSQWAAIWACIENESILLDYCDGVARKEFGTPLYFYDILVDYYLEILRSEEPWQCAGRLTEEFSYLSGLEFSFILTILFSKLYRVEFRSISEETADCFFKAIIGKVFEFDTVDDLEHCQWAASNVVNDTYRDAFLYGGDYMCREKSWSMLERMKIVIVDGMDMILDAGLVQS